MKKGFGYIVFLFFIVIALSIIVNSFFILQKYNSIIKMDYANKQALLYALSAMVFLDEKENIPDLGKNKVLWTDIINAEGPEYKFNYGGCKIINCKNKYYLTGYFGRNINAAQAVKVLERNGGEIILWREE